jgi:hypothetical protein
MFFLFILKILKVFCVCCSSRFCLAGVHGIPCKELGISFDDNKLSRECFHYFVQLHCAHKGYYVIVREISWIL